MATSGLVSQWSHTSNGEHSIIGGQILEWVEKLYAHGHLMPGITEEKWNRDYNAGFGFDPEALKRLLDQDCVDAGVEVRLAPA